MAVLPKTKICGHSVAGIAVSNAVESMDVRLLCVLCTVWVVASAPTDLSFRGSLPCACACACACACVCVSKCM